MIWTGIKAQFDPVWVLSIWDWLLKAFQSISFQQYSDGSMTWSRHRSQNRFLTHSPLYHDVVIRWKHFPSYWPFVRGIHRSSVNSSHKGQWCGALMFSLICVWINGWVNNCEAGDLRCHRAYYDIIVIMMAATIHLVHHVNTQLQVGRTITLNHKKIQMFRYWINHPMMH